MSNSSWFLFYTYYRRQYLSHTVKFGPPPRGQGHMWERSSKGQVFVWFLAFINLFHMDLAAWRLSNLGCVGKSIAFYQLSHIWASSRQPKPCKKGRKRPGFVAFFQLVMVCKKGLQKRLFSTKKVKIWKKFVDKSFKIGLYLYCCRRKIFFQKKCTS